MSDFRTQSSERPVISSCGELPGGVSGRQPGTHSLEVILGLLPLVLGLQLIIWIVYLPAALRGNADFRVYYAGGYLVRSGQGNRLYDDEQQNAAQNALVSRYPTVLPFTHLPYEALVFAPFSLLPYQAAYFSFLGLNLLCLAACYLLLRRRLWRLQRMWRWFPFLAVLGFGPVSAALMQDQDSLILLILLAVALKNMDDGDSLRSGLMLGLGIFRFQLILPMVFLFIVWRRWQIVLGTLTSTLLAGASSALVSGSTGLLLYARRLYDIGVKRQGLDLALYGVPVTKMPNLRGLVFSIPRLTSGVGMALVLMLSLIVIVIAGWSGRAACSRWQFAIAISAATLVGYHVLTHDLSILLVPFAMLLDEFDGRELWTITFLWLSVVLCFFAYDYLVTLPLLVFFSFLVVRVRQNSNCMSPTVWKERLAEKDAAD